MAKEEQKKDAPSTPKLGTYKVTFGSVVLGGGINVPEGDPVELSEEDAKSMQALGIVAPL